MPIKCTTIPIINATYLSSNTDQLMKNAARDGAEIISPMSEPLRKISFVGRIDRPFLSNGSVEFRR